MSKHDFRAALLRADELARQGGLPPDVDARLWQRLQTTISAAERRPLLSRGISLSLVAAACAFVLLTIFVWRGQHQERLGGFLVAAKTADLTATERTDGTIEISAGVCTLVEPRSRAQVTPRLASSVRLENAGVRVARGEVEFQVPNQTAAVAPFVVWVSGGAIRVIGTHFIVRQGDAGGTVELREGHVRFACASGGVRELGAGQSLAWPCLPRVPEKADIDVPPTPKPTDLALPSRRLSSASDKAPGAENAAPPDIEAVLDRVASLRTRHLYEDAVGELTHATVQPWPTTTRERLSFEKGAILTDLIGDSRRACAHWREHAQLFSAGRYLVEVAQARARAGCDALDRGQGDKP